MQCAPFVMLHCAMWVGADEHGNREYALDCLDSDGPRYAVHRSDLLEAVCTLTVLLACNLSDV